MRHQRFLMFFSCLAVLIWSVNASEQSEIELLIKQLSDSKVAVRRHAAWELGKIGERANVGVPALILAIEDKDKEVRVNATWALGQMGQLSKEVIPVLIQVVNDQEKEVHRQ